MSRRKYGKIFLIFLIAILGLACISASALYYVKRNDLKKQEAKVQKQLDELPELEKDIFLKCMQDKGGKAEDIAFCQENTQKQMYTLSQDLTNAKKDLQNKKWYQVLQ